MTEGGGSHAGDPVSPGALVAFAFAYALLAAYTLGLPVAQRFPPFVWPGDGLALGALLGDLEAGANGQLVDVEDLEDNERVQIYVE